jgi:hypothetical protein
MGKSAQQRGGMRQLARGLPTILGMRADGRAAVQAPALGRSGASSALPRTAPDGPRQQHVPVVGFQNSVTGPGLGF